MKFRAENVLLLPRTSHFLPAGDMGGEINHKTFLHAQTEDYFIFTISSEHTSACVYLYHGLCIKGSGLGAQAVLSHQEHCATAKEQELLSGARV